MNLFHYHSAFVPMPWMRNKVGLLWLWVLDTQQHMILPARRRILCSMRSDKLIIRLPSNCHSWKSRFFFVGGEWAAKENRDLVPSRWDTALRTKLASPPLSAEQESRLQTIRDYPTKDFAVLMSTSGHSRASPKQKKKGTTIDRAMVETLYASRVVFSPPPKRAKTDAPSASRSRSDVHASQEAGSSGALTSSQHAAPSSARVSPSTVLGAETPVRSTIGAEAPHSCLASSSGSVSMLQDVNLAKEHLWNFVTVADIREVGSRGPDDIIDTAIEGFSMVCFPSI